MTRAQEKLETKVKPFSYEKKIHNKGWKNPLSHVCNFMPVSGRKMAFKRLQEKKLRRYLKRKSEA